MGISLLIIFICMLLSAFFSGIETGVISIHRLRLRHAFKHNVPGAALLSFFMKNSDRLLGTTLVGNNISNVVLSVLATSIAVALLGAWGELAATVVMTLLVLLFCEFLPKAWFNARPLDRCLRFAVPLQFAELLLRPFSLSVIWITHRFIPREAHSFSRAKPFITRDDLKHLAHESARSGVFSSRERDMIQSVIDLSRKSAKDVMVPLDKMVAVTEETTVAEFLETVRRSGFTRIPVREKPGGRFSGVLNVFYVLRNLNADDSRSIKSLMRTPLFIKENMPADEILPRLRRLRQPLGLVKDAAGSVIGLVTTEDVLEEIVGELD